MSPPERFMAQTGGCIAVLTQRGSARKIHVRISAINAVVVGNGGQSEHGAAIHVGEPHPIKVEEAAVEVLQIIGWARLPGPGAA